MLPPQWPAGRGGILAAVGVTVVLQLAAPPAAAQGGAGASVRVGDTFRFDGHLRAQMDWRDFPADPDNPQDLFDLHRMRGALEVRLLRRLEFQVERELRDTPDPWRDVFLNLDLHRSFQVRAGKFKIPFSLDRLTSSARLDFIYRSLAATHLAPGRDTGVMVYGNLRNRLVRYEVGVFRRGGDNVRASKGDDQRDGPTLGGRMALRPWRAAGAQRRRGALVLGASFMSGYVPRGLDNLSGSTIPGDPLWAPRYVQGRRHRLGGELDWRTGPFSLRTELIRGLDQRRSQGTDDDTLGKLVTQGWYVSGTWIVTGERKDDTIQPRKPFLQGGPGAIELGLRVEDLRIGSVRAGPEPPSRSPRARTVEEAGDRVVTFGVTWFVNRFVRLQANLIRELRAMVADDMSGGGPAWSRVLRLQLEL